MSLFREKQIYASVHESKVWSIVRDYHKARIVTFIYERSFWKFHFFRVKQYYPRIPNPFYMSEVESNNNMDGEGAEQKGVAYKWLEQYIKNGYKEEI